MKHRQTAAPYARERTARIIKDRFSASYMSDAKWVRLLNGLVEIAPAIALARVKLVWDEAIRELAIDENLQFDFDYYAHAMEGMVSGSPRGWYDYREIEWLELVTSGEKAEAVVAHIASIGDFETERTADGLRLYGYR